ncbi:MAG TPA: cyclase family protein [Vicinamibacterales bacterium]|jgi:arylformamidase|nr:cyclase family protein [Vicinamibacterales bacterium]
MKLIDVSVPLDAKLPTYPNNTPFTIEATKRIADGGSSNVSSLHLSAHTGTHVDAPRHFFDAGPGTEALPLDMLLGRARVVEVTSRKGITADDLAAFNLSEDVRVLIKTSNSRLWGFPEFHPDYVGVTESGARHLVDHGVKVVGVDYLSVEQFHTPGAPAHHVLLGAGVIVIEGLNLRDVEPGVYDMYCLPLLIVGCDGAPARVVLRRS